MDEWDDMMRVRLRKNLFERWIVVHPELEDAAWTGSRWQSIGKDGMPTGPFPAQVSNLSTREEAAEYARGCGFEVEAQWEHGKSSSKTT